MVKGLQTIEGEKHHQERDAHLDELQNLLCGVLHLVSFMEARDDDREGGWGESVRLRCFFVFFEKGRNGRNGKRGEKKGDMSDQRSAYEAFLQSCRDFPAGPYAEDEDTAPSEGELLVQALRRERACIDAVVEAEADAWDAAIGSAERRALLASLTSNLDALSSGDAVLMLLKQSAAESCGKCRVSATPAEEEEGEARTKVEMVAAVRHSVDQCARLAALEPSITANPPSATITEVLQTPVSSL